jgi:hypothetical protein
LRALQRLAKVVTDVTAIPVVGQSAPQEKRFQRQFDRDGEVVESMSWIERAHCIAASKNPLALRRKPRARSRSGAGAIGGEPPSRCPAKDLMSAIAREIKP